MKSWIRIISISIFFSIMVSCNVTYAADTISQNEWEEYDFEVKVEHITGLFVPNKTVEVKYNDKIYREITNEKGVAKFTINLIDVDQENTAPRYSSIAIYNGDATEYTSSEENIPVYVLNSNTYAEIKNIYCHFAKSF